MFEQKKGSEIKVKSPSKTAPLLGVLLILASVAGYIFFTEPLSDDVSAMKDSVSSASESIDELKQEIENFQEAQEELKVSTEVQRIEVLKSVPVAVNQDEVIRDIIGITEDYDIDLNSISFGKSGANIEGVESLRVNASFEGSYLDLINFLEAVEQNARLLRINSISVQISTIAITGLQRATFSLSMEAFYQESQ
ncbi:type 4a pilus biogenesis protein PilO [Candidatus Peregrinibacteria bacterium]|nr:type 4a pilus biogenesis protein PilO [Candidatus Peregrinibacteria bacterium]